MRRTILTLGAIATALPASLALPGAASDAMARTRHHAVRHYQATAHERRCRPSSGTTGLIAGGVGGAVVGSKVIGGGLLGTAVGAAGGALAGRAIDRTITAKKRCN